MNNSIWHPITDTPLWSDVIATCVTFLVIMLNSKEISVLYKTKKKKALEKFLLALSMTDLFLALTSSSAGMVAALEKYFHLFEMPQEVMVAWSLTSLWGVLICVMHIICISLDRLFAICRPFQHKVYVTGGVIKKSIVGAWCLSSIVVLANIIIILVNGMLHRKGFVPVFHYIVRQVAISILIGDIVCMISYSMIATFISKRNRTQSREPNKRQQRKTFLLCMAVVAIFVLSTAPIMITYIVPWEAPIWLKGVSLNIIAFNSVGNSAIYLIQYYATKRENCRPRIDSKSSSLHDYSNRNKTEAKQASHQRIQMSQNSTK